MTTSFTGGDTYTDCICVAGYYVGENVELCLPCSGGDCDSCDKDAALRPSAEVLHVGQVHARVLFPCKNKMKRWGYDAISQLVDSQIIGRSPFLWGLRREDWGEGLSFANLGNKNIIDIRTAW